MLRLSRGLAAALSVVILALCCSLAHSRELGPLSRVRFATSLSSWNSAVQNIDGLISTTSRETTPTSTSKWPFSPKRVDVTLYGEAKCPFCAKWITANALELVSQLESIIDFRVVEWGNARRNATTGVVSCQHGPTECYANALFACNQEAFGRSEDDPYRWLRVVACSEKNVFEKAADPSDNFDACVTEEVARGGDPFDPEGERSSSFDDDDDEKKELGKEVAKKIRACAESERGQALVAGAERETSSLSPPHTFVPWVVVDGIPVGDASLEVVRAVACAAWRGKERPDVCFKAPGLGTTSVM